MFADPPPPQPESPRVTAMRANAQALLATLRLAQALTASGEHIDLSGLDNQIGRICAGVLDLPPDEGRGLREDMIALRQQAEALQAALRAQAPPP